MWLWVSWELRSELVASEGSGLFVVSAISVGHMALQMSDSEQQEAKGATEHVREKLTTPISGVGIIRVRKTIQAKKCTQVCNHQL